MKKILFWAAALLALPFQTASAQEVVVAHVGPMSGPLAVNGVGTAACLSISYAMGRFTKTESLESVLDRHPKIKRYFSATASLTMEDGEMTDLFDMNAVHVLPAPDPEENAVQRDLLARDLIGIPLAIPALVVR